MKAWDKAAIELSFIREFATGGNLIGRCTFRDLVERIRVAILKGQREGLLLAGTNLSYAEAFEQWSGQRLEKRGVSREIPRASHAPDPDEDDFDSPTEGDPSNVDETSSPESDPRHRTRAIAESADDPENPSRRRSGRSDRRA